MCISKCVWNCVSVCACEQENAHEVRASLVVLSPYPTCTRTKSHDHPPAHLHVHTRTSTNTHTQTRPPLPPPRTNTDLVWLQNKWARPLRTERLLSLFKIWQNPHNGLDEPLVCMHVCTRVYGVYACMYMWIGTCLLHACRFAHVHIYLSAFEKPVYN